MPKDIIINADNSLMLPLGHATVTNDVAKILIDEAAAEIVVLPTEKLPSEQKNIPLKRPKPKPKPRQKRDKK